MERPILFSGPMVRAILEGRKSMTRRVVKPQPPYPAPWKLITCICTTGNKKNEGKHHWAILGDHARIRDEYPAPDKYFACPYGYEGDRLWVKETWAEYSPGSVAYRATGRDRHLVHAWRPSIFMPRWASRITLEITGVRVERLQEITEEDAEREGVSFDERNQITARENFENLWNQINGKSYPWSSNPFVWVVEFKRVH